MKIHVHEPKLRLPLRHLSKPEFCNKVLRDFKNSLQDNLDCYRRKFEHRHASQLSILESFPSCDNQEWLSNVNIPLQNQFRKLKCENVYVLKKAKRLRVSSKKRCSKKRHVTEQKTVSSPPKTINIHQKSHRFRKIKTQTYPQQQKQKTHQRCITQTSSFFPFLQIKTHQLPIRSQKSNRLQQITKISPALTNNNFSINDSLETLKLCKDHTKQQQNRTRYYDQVEQAIRKQNTNTCKSIHTKRNIWNNHTNTHHYQSVTMKKCCDGDQSLRGWTRYSAKRWAGQIDQSVQSQLYA